jgi:hypothetical protein
MTEVFEPSKDFDKKKLKTKIELGTNNEDSHAGNIHSLVWEDTEANEGFTAREIITGDSE